MTVCHSVKNKSARVCEREPYKGGVVCEWGVGVASGSLHVHSAHRMTLSW
jgi:hypothetical protein